MSTNVLDTTDHSRSETHVGRVGGVDLLGDSDHGHPAAHRTRVAVPDPSTRPGRAHRETHCSAAGLGDSVEGPVFAEPTPISNAPDPRPFDELQVLAESFEDAQKARIAISNRIASGTVPPDVAADGLAALKHAEQKLGLAMRKSFRRAAPDVYAWVKDTPGVGEHLAARLLGTVGHPVWAFPHHWEGEGSDRELIADEPFQRNVAKLWAYCGHGDPARRRAKGMTSDEACALGNPRAKMLAHLIAEGAMKCTGTAKPPPSSIIGALAGAHLLDNGHDPSDFLTRRAVVDPLRSDSHATNDAQAGLAVAADLLDDEPATPAPMPTPLTSVRRRSPYRDVYEQGRERYADRDWTPGHQNNAALRLTAKAILRDLWIVANQSLTA